MYQKSIYLRFGGIKYFYTFAIHKNLKYEKATTII